MSDIPDWEAKYWANRLQQKATGNNQISQPNHHEPLHVTQAKQRGEDPNSFLRNYPQFTGASNMNDPRVAASRELSGQLSARDVQNNVKVVMLREGATYYRQVQSEGYGTTIPLLRGMGKLNNISGKEFELRGPSRGYVVDGLPVIDAGKMNENPERFVNLVKVRTNFIGDIFVDSSALIEHFGGQKTILRG
jgi:hypothetical protein